MAYVPVTINGVAYPKAKDGSMKPFPVTIVGTAWLTGLSVGGGPTPGGPPPHVEHPIPPWAEHPIELPPVDTAPPDIPMVPSEPKPPPADGGWGWSPEYGWGYFPPPGSARPKR
jgi:hypothetical protein